MTTVPPDSPNHPPDAYFAPLNPLSPGYDYFTESNRLFWTTMHAVLPTDDDDTDLAYARLSRILGISRRRAEKNYYGVTAMAGLPQLTAAHEATWMLDDERLDVIGQQLLDVAAELLPLIDDALVALFTPTAKNQELPTCNHIAKTIRDILNQYYDLTEENPGKNKDEDGTRYRMTHHGQRSHLGLDMDALDAEALDAHVRKYADAHNVSHTKALLELVFNGATTTVVINVFKSDAHSLAYLPEHGFIDPTKSTHPIVIRNLEPGRTDAYVPTDVIRAFIEARDGTCRRADCTVPAKHAQLDHRVEYGEGGDTCTDNLIAVCQHHHNVKTDRRCDYILDPATGTVYWLFEDGTWESTEPKGIMATHWKQTIGQRTAQLAAERNLVPLPEPEEISFDD